MICIRIVSIRVAENCAELHTTAYEHLVSGEFLKSRGDGHLETRPEGVECNGNCGLLLEVIAGRHLFEIAF
jgi:hypothetical protein